MSIACATASAQRARSTNDEQVVQQASLVAAGPLVELYQHGMTVDPAFLALAEQTCRKLEQLTGVALDTATLGPKLRIYVSDATPISHVWRGYEHPKDPKGIVLLNQRAYLGAMNGSNATYAHELAHLYTWRFHSHTLREGLADYLALQIHPGAGVGPNAQGFAGLDRIAPEVLEHLGTNKPAPAAVMSDAYTRRSYYYASYRFVKYLIEKEGMGVFMKLYATERTEDELRKLYGASREELVRGAGM